MPLSVTWFIKSAEQGHPRAQYYLGRSYFEVNGNPIGVPKDTRKAVSWWQQAAAQGDADAQEALGFCYAKGFGGLVKDEIEGYAYYILASRSNPAAVFRRQEFENSLSPESLRAGMARSKVLLAGVVPSSGQSVAPQSAAPLAVGPSAASSPKPSAPRTSGQDLDEKMGSLFGRRMSDEERAAPKSAGQK